jgi:hypothetical protein
MAGAVPPAPTFVQDAAVAAAYGWTDYTPDLPEEEILRRLLALNLERAAKSRGEQP